MRLPNLLLAALLCTVVAACYGDDDHAAHGHGPTGSVCPSVQSLSYDNFGKAFFTTYCLHCHSTAKSGAARMDAPSDHNYDTLSDIKAFTDHIDQHAAAGPDATNLAMPIGEPKPTEAERKKLGEWLACGAPM